MPYTPLKRFAKPEVDAKLKAITKMEEYLYAQAAGGGGSVTTISVASSNGFTGSVATPTTTPVITLATSITGVLKGNGTAISAATSGTDYQAPISGTGFVKATGSTISYDNSTYLTTTVGASTYLPLAGGTLTGNLLFTDNTRDIGAAGATRPRTGYFGTSLVSPLFNGLAITNNGTNTLTIGAGKTLSITNSLNLIGTDGTNMTFPSTSATIARTDAAQSFTGTQTFAAVQLNGAVGLGGSGTTFSSGGASTTNYALFQQNVANTLTTGNVSNFSIFTSYNQASGSGSNSDLRVNRTETAVMSGLQKLISLEVGSVLQFGVDNKGKLLFITGANKSVGTATLVSGTVTVSNTIVTAASTIMISLKTPGGTLGFLQQGTIVAGTSFVINSLVAAGTVNTADTSTVNWWIIN